jgi:hypothetical protein
MSTNKHYINITLFLIILTSCSGEPNLQDLSYKDGLAYINDTPFSGEALEYYNEEETNKKSIVSFEDGITLKKVFYSENGDLVSDEIFSNNKISIRNKYLKGRIFIVEDINNNSQKTTDIICEEECIYEDVKLEDVILSAVTLSNVTFKSSTFKNVTIEGSDSTKDGLVVLSNIKFIDSSLDAIKFGKNVKTSKSDGADSSNIIFDNVTGKIEVSVNKDGRSNIHLSILNSDIEEFTLNSLPYFPKSNGKRVENNLSLQTENSSFENFTFLSFNRSGNRPVLDMKNTVIEMVHGLSVGSGSGKSFNKVYESKNSFLCENSEFKNGNLAMIVDYCDDMGEDFDEFALKDFEKKYVPDNTLTYLKKYTKLSDFSPIYKSATDELNYGVGGSLEYLSSDSDKNKNNQMYAIVSGNAEWLENYIREVYVLALRDRVGFKEINPCLDNNLLYFVYYRNSVPEGCETKTLDRILFTNWFVVPDSFKSPLGDNQNELLIHRLGGGTKADNLKREKYASVDFSNNGRKKAVKKYFDAYHNFSGLKNCLRGKSITNAKNILSNLPYEIVQKTDGYESRFNRTKSILMMQEASESKDVSIFGDCVKDNVSIFTPQVFDAYKPISDLARIAEEELSIFRDEDKRIKEEKRRIKIAEREKLFDRFINTDQATSICSVMKTPTMSRVINMDFAGSAEAKKKRVTDNYNACNRCAFYTWSNFLNNNDDFKNMVNGIDLPDSIMQGFSMADMKGLAMCAVAGADRKIQLMFSQSIQ